MSPGLARSGVWRKLQTGMRSGGTPAYAPRRMLATDEPVVSWSQYRAGDKTLQQWVEANRHVVAGSMFAFYVALAAWNLRPGKRSGGVEPPAASPAAPPAEDAAPPAEDAAPPAPQGST